MGLRNLRATCPSCGGKIHTRPKGLGHITWANSWFLVQTGSECEHCGIALTGKVKADGRAEAVAEPKTTLLGFVKTNGPAPVAAAPPAIPPAEREGWWPDPAGRYKTRYFDGINWTWRVANDGDATVDPLGALTH